MAGDAQQLAWRRAARTSRGEALSVGDPRDDAFIQLRMCTDLDQVLAIDTPVRLVGRLFGVNASKTLIEPLGDALLRDLARGSHNFSSIGLASAASDILDPGRLAVVLRWDDEGHNLIPGSSPTDLAEDLRATVGHYVDPKRRLSLVQSLWIDLVVRNGTLAGGDALLAEAKHFARNKLGRSAEDVVDAFTLAASKMSRSRAAAMCFEWAAQEFLREQTVMLRYSAADREVLIHLPSWMRSDVPTGIGRNKLLLAARDLLVASARLHHASTHILPHLPSDHSKRGEATRQLADLTKPEALSTLSEQVDSLIRFSGLDRAQDHERMLDNNRDIMVYRGMGASLRLKVPDDFVAYIPPAVKTLDRAVAQVAQLVRFGAALPDKPSSWPVLLARTCEPYYVHPTVTIDAPEWVSELHGKEVPGTDLVCRVPRDMAELSKWADHMGNCIKSIFGAGVNEGRRVILGLFRGDELLYNVGVFANSRRIWEINSRFNSDEVPPEVNAGADLLVARVRRDELPATGRIRPPKSRGRRKQPTFTVAQGVLLTKTFEDIRHDAQRVDAPGTDALRQLLSEATGDHVAPQTWPSLVTALRRIDPAVLKESFQRGVSGNTIANGWNAALTHPLDQAIAVIDDSVVRASFERLRDGDERAQLAHTAPLLDNAVFDAAWQLGIIQQMMRSTLADMVSEPRSLRHVVHGDASGNARRTLFLLFQNSVDQGMVHRRLPTAFFDITDLEAAKRAWLNAAQLDHVATEQMLARHGFAGTRDVELIAFTMRRAERGLPLAQCPRVWFTG